MTQAGRSRTAAPAVILAGAVVLLLVSLIWAHVRRTAAPGAVPAHPMMAAAADPVSLLETRAAQQPHDGEAWHALAAQYFDGGRYADAVRAYARATALLPKRAILWSALGEASVMASAHDPMPAAALGDFRRAIALDPKDPRARYFLAVARDLSGDHKGAIEDWLALLADTPPGAAWQNDLRRTIEQVGKVNGIAVDARIAALEQKRPQPIDSMPMPSAAMPGPSASDIQAAAGLTADQQKEMGAGMVARLEQRLRAYPANPDGWVMLMRSYMTLGQPAAAAAALRKAITANPGEAEELNRQAAILGIS